MASNVPPNADDLMAPATQIVRDRDAYLGQSNDIGRRLAEDQVELFVGADPAVALQREFDRLSPSFVALHDIGTSSSLRLLQSMAATTGKVMRLTIRRQGQGVPLATVQFVEIAGGDGASLRVYSTDIDADMHSRHEIARVLLSHARLAVVIFGDLPGHALAASLQEMSGSLARERWPNRHMLMIPLGSPVAVNQLAQPFREAGIDVQVSPRVARATDAWSFIGGRWNQLEAAATGAPPPAAGGERDEPPTQPMSLERPRPAAPSAVDWFDFVQRCASVKGMISCCVFDRGNGQALAHAGGRPPAEVMQALGEQLLTTAGNIGAMMGTGTDVLEASVSFSTHHLLLRTLPRHPGVVLHAVLDAATGNVALARAQLQRLDPI